VNNADSKYEHRGNFCTKCGYNNLHEARYCAECGFFLGDISKSQKEKQTRDIESPPDRPTDSYEIIEETKEIHRCIRCGQDIEGLDICQVCGLKTPENPDIPDEFLTDFMARFPLLITNPEKFVDTQPYRLGWTSFIQPVLWTTLSFIAFCVVVFLSRGSNPIVIWESEIPLGTFLMISMAAIVMVFPWLLLLYTVILQLGAIIVRGRGILERTNRAICSMLYGEFLLLGTLLALLNISNQLLNRYSGFLLDSPWKSHYTAIPLIIKISIILAQLFFLTIQIRILARVNYIDIFRSVMAHVIIALPFAVYFTLNHFGYI